MHNHRVAPEGAHTHGREDMLHAHGINGPHRLSMADIERQFGAHQHGINCPELEPGARAAPLTQIVTVTVKLLPDDIAEIISDMQRAIADSLGIPAHMLFGEQEPCSAEARRLMTVAAFPHTPG